MITAQDIPHVKIRPRIIRIEESALMRYLVYRRLTERMAEGQHLYDADDIAQILDISDWHIHQAINKGLLKSEPDGARHQVVNLSDLLIWLSDYLEERKEKSDG